MLRVRTLYGRASAWVVMAQQGRAAARRAYVFTVSPPLGCRVWPEKYEASSEARNTWAGPGRALAYDGVFNLRPVPRCPSLNSIPADAR